MESVIPCPLCGYDSPDRLCRHCGLSSQSPELSSLPAGPVSGILEGLRAVPRGLLLLLRTRGVKRFMIPPLVLTLLLFAALFVWTWRRVKSFVDAAAAQDVSQLGLDEGWFRDSIAWLLERSAVIWLAQASGLVLVILTSSLIALWTFSIAYEAMAGPFLDEIHGRFEKRWFGANPRDAIQRPTDLPVRSCVLLSGLAAVPALVLIAFWYFAPGASAWILAAVPIPFLLAGVLNRRYGVWLAWVVRLESETLWISIKASLLAGAVMLFFLWLKLIPGLGFVLFAAVAGFTTALSLLDIPFSRRQWSLRTRLDFLARNLAPVTAYGAVAGLLFLIPVIGPLLMVPSASVGGLWMLCRLDKGSLRGREQRSASE